MAPGQPYRSRILDADLTVLIASLPALAIEGAKGVGKTFTATQRAGSVHELDDPQQLAVAKADPVRLLGTHPPVLIDEWQRLPETWDLVRRAVDRNNAAGQFLLTGSVSPQPHGTHSGAGRIVSMRMRPLTLAERSDQRPTVSLADLLTGGRPTISGTTGLTVEEYIREILASGFPGLRGLEGRALRAQLDSYLDRIVDRDFPELGHELRNPGALRRWMTAYAAASSTTASFEKVRDASTAGAGSTERPTKVMTQGYRDALERLWILDPVPAWTPARNQIARLSLPPKHQLADPALAARLLGVTSQTLLMGQSAGPAIVRDGTLLGALFESLVTLSTRVYAQASEARVFHLRTWSGDREVDLIVERGDGRVVALEVKLARTIDERDVRHLWWLKGEIGDDLLDMAVVTTGTEAYRRRDGIAVIPASLLGP